MALLKKGSRRLVIDGISYRWRVRNRPTYCQANGWTRLVLAVERADISGGKLMVKLPQAHPDNWFGEEVVAVLPSHVACYVRQALSMGWQSDRPGKPFPIDVIEAKTNREQSHDRG